MAYSDPRTWVTGELVTAALMNAQLRDNLDAIVEGTTGAYVNAVTGPHAIGGSTVDYVRMGLTGAFTSGGASTVAFGLYTSGALTGHSGDSAAIAGIKANNSIVTAGNCTTIAQLWVSEPQITVGSGTVTNSATVYIENAASEATNDYALWVDAGTTRIDGDIELGNATDTTLARASAGDVSIEGNIIYRAGGTDVPVTDGGTGASSLTDGGILMGSGTGAITAMSVLTDGQMIVGDGSGDPALERGATLRTSIGVGTGDEPEFAKVSVNTSANDGLLAVVCDTGAQAFFSHQETTNEINAVFRGGASNSTVNVSFQSDSAQVAAITNAGALSKASGSFRIPHPHPSKADTHDLVHSFVESNRAGLVYDGEVDLVAGAATIDMDELVGMTSGTWVLLTRDPHVFTSNETGWDPVRGTVSGATLTIECENASSTDTVSYMVVAERQDAHMISEDVDWTDEEGRPIIEPLRVQI